MFLAASACVSGGCGGVCVSGGCDGAAAAAYLCLWWPRLVFVRLRQMRRLGFLVALACVPGCGGGGDWRPLLVLLSAAVVACVSGACGGASCYRRPRLRQRLLFLAAFACSAAAAEFMCCHLVDLYCSFIEVGTCSFTFVAMISHIFNLFLLADCLKLEHWTHGLYG